jgi:hypothetical protein
MTKPLHLRVHDLSLQDWIGIIEVLWEKGCCIAGKINDWVRCHGRGLMVKRLTCAEA